MNVPFVDLHHAHAEVAAEVQAGWSSVLARTAFIAGEEVDTFEREYAQFCQVPHCVGVGNGTDALELCLRAVGVGAGDEVILPANTFIATAEAVRRTGAVPVLADCDPVHLLLDPHSALERVTPRTRAIIPVHLFGQCAPVETLEGELPENVVLIEDAAQAQGALRHGRAAGGLGALAGTSFYPGKNLGAYGDAGAVTTWSSDMAQRIRAMRNHGGESKYDHQVLGVNSRLDTLQAVVLSAKLKRLAAWNERRRQAAQRYASLLADLPDVVTPSVMGGNEHVWHLYVVQLPRRDQVLAAMQAAGIGVGIHYPQPVHRTPAFADLAGAGGCLKVSENAAERILSLPMFPSITADQQERVVTALREALG